MRKGNRRKAIARERAKLTVIFMNINNEAGPNEYEMENHTRQFE